MFKEKADTQNLFEADEDGFVNFGDVSRRLLGKQAQYGSRYINDAFKSEYPQLGEGLRIKGNPDDYHSIRIHKDDVEEFVRRYNEFKQNQEAE
ncbi:MAG: hypothetical protein PHQ47_02390 [Candidatus Portnoybacteria bacterium]|nr:hypothetical protein [Candidatus Portnoybacteria bacterium]